jgi:hypothetical protein
MSRRNLTRVCSLILLLMVLGAIAAPVHTRAADPGSIDWALVHEITTRHDRFTASRPRGYTAVDSVARMARKTRGGISSSATFPCYALDRVETLRWVRETVRICDLCVRAV